MSLKHALLGFLNMWPLSGYDLAKMFTATVGFFWSATHTQIYRTLKAMQQEGLLEPEIVEQTSHPNKKLYHITQQGREELLRWIARPAEIPPIRHPLLLKLTLADGASTEVLERTLDDYSDKLRQRIAVYKTRNRAITNQYARNKRERFLWNAVLDNGIALYEGELLWVQQTRARLVELARVDPETEAKGGYDD